MITTEALRLQFHISNPLFCPLTEKIIIEPAVASDGYTYEKSAIITYISRNIYYHYGNYYIISSPITRQYIKLETRDNFAFKKLSSLVIELQNKVNRTQRFDDEIPEEMPQEYYCSITHEPFMNPVVSADGQSYEEKDITQWFKKSRTSPLTGKDLDDTSLFPNLSLTLLKNLYQKYQSILKSRFERKFSFNPNAAPFELSEQYQAILSFPIHERTRKNTIKKILRKQIPIKEKLDEIKQLLESRETLFFGGNIRMPTDHIYILCEAIKENKSIKILDLRHIKMDSQGAIHVAELLKVNSTIKELYLFGNDIDDTGAFYLSEALAINESPELLVDITDNLITKKGADALEFICKTKPSLRIIYTKQRSPHISFIEEKKHIATSSHSKPTAFPFWQQKSHHNIPQFLHFYPPSYPHSQGR